MTLPLRPYQVRTLERTRAAYRAGKRRPLIVSPTGSGKTVLGVAIVHGASVRKGRRVLWAVHRRELVEQAHAAILDTGIDPMAVGVILAGDKRARGGAPIQVCSIQTLTAAGEAPEADVIVLDEAHHAVAATWAAIVRAYPRLEMLLGLTATPERGDGAGLGDVFDCITEAASTQELTDMGYLVPADVIAPAEYRDKLAMAPVDAWTRYAPGALTVMFCRDVAHAMDTAVAFQRAGVSAAWLSGETPTRERDSLLAALASGRLRVLCNVDVLTEGWDCPRIQCVGMFRRTDTWGRWMQAVGRGLRTASGKSRCTILDPYGLVHRFGLPTDPRVFSLSGTSATPTALSLRQCRACGAVFRVDVCPRCGWRAPPRPAPRVKETEMQRVERVEKIPEAVKRGALGRWRRESAEKGWKPGAVTIRFRVSFGHEIPEGW
jgi:DNA repair protein RadD